MWRVRWLRDRRGRIGVQGDRTGEQWLNLLMHLLLSKRHGGVYTISRARPFFASFAPLRSLC